MQALTKCSSCDGLVPSGQQACPHCESPVVPTRSRSKVAAAMALVSAGAASVTLMACYGMPPCDYQAPDGSTRHNGTLCKNVCVDPDSTVAKRCYDVAVSDGGADAGTTDGG